MRAAGFNQVEVRLRGGVQNYMITSRLAPQRRQMIDSPPELVFQIMDDRARRPNRR